ncbi:MAG: regulatory protein GntR [Gemmatimonadetes bacterium]|nr:regulatory protein GntR [Gemmatimonadota bacterium]
MGRAPQAAATKDSPPQDAVPEPRTSIAETLRGRVLRGLQAGTLRPGDRLPSARELVTEFQVDHRLILVAYRQLADEELVDVRERGGVYVAMSTSTRAGFPALPIKWFVEMLTEGFAHEIPAPELHEWLRRSIETLRLRAVVITSTWDQAAGLARELRDDFGVIADGIVGSDLAHAEVRPAVLRHADVLIATAAHIELARQIGAELNKPTVVVDVRPDLVVGEWALLLRQPLYAVVATAEFGEMLKKFFADVRGIDNLHILVHGTDDLSAIPDGAPTYVTHRVREALAGTPIRGRLLPAARTISTASAREIFNFIVRANLEASRAVRPAPSDEASRQSSA